MTSISDFFTSSLAEKCAQEILVAFKENGNSETIEVDFNLSGGKMVEPLNKTNTWFKFDSRESGGSLQQVFESLTELWRKDSTEEGDAQVVRDFELQVNSHLQSQVNTCELADILRKVIFQSVPAAILPIEKVKFHRVEFAGADEQGYLLRIEKLARVDRETGQYIDPPQALAKELIQIHTETGQDFKEIIEEKKLAGDARYELVANAHLERYIRDVTVTLSGDYSFCDNTELNLTT